MDFKVRREDLINHGSNIREHYMLSSTTLGEGSYGVVRMATRYSDYEIRAVKIIPKSRVKNREILDSEIKVLKQMDHPNIVRLYEVYENSRYIYLVMEMCEGGELFDKLMEMGHFSEKEAASIMTQMLEAVLFMHEKGFAHRDLKPENFMFASEKLSSTLKLIDFGLSKSVENKEKFHTKIGSSYYISPEVLQGDYDSKCDLWSLGVILFIMLSGFPPFDGDTDAEIIQTVKQGKLAFSQEIWQSISDEAKDLIEKLLDRDPQTRISAQEALRHPWITNYEDFETIKVNLEVKLLEEYRRAHKLKKTVLNYMATQCSSEELEELISTFRSIDTGKNGYLSIEEIENVVNSSEIPHNTLVQLISDLSTEKSHIEMNVFIAAMMDAKLYLNQEKLWNAFKRFDLRNSGKITPEDIREVLDHDHTVSDPGYWEEIIKEVDLNGDGEINFEEFVSMMGG